MKNQTAKLTDAQRNALATATSKLPQGFYYQLHDELDNGGTGRVWGVSVYSKIVDGPLAYGSKDCEGHVYVEQAERPAMQLMLNRAMAALWHKQPIWAKETPWVSCAHGIAYTHECPICDSPAE